MTGVNGDVVGRALGKVMVVVAMGGDADGKKEKTGHVGECEGRGGDREAEIERA